MNKLHNGNVQYSASTSGIVQEISRAFFCRLECCTEMLGANVCTFAFSVFVKCLCILGNSDFHGHRPQGCLNQHLLW